MIHYKFKNAARWYDAPFTRPVHRNDLIAFIQTKHNVKNVYVQTPTDIVRLHSWIEIATISQTLLRVDDTVSSKSPPLFDVDVEFGPDPFADEYIPLTIRKVPSPIYDDEFAMGDTDAMILKYII